MPSISALTNTKLIEHVDVMVDASDLVLVLTDRLREAIQEIVTLTHDIARLSADGSDT